LKRNFLKIKNHLLNLPVNGEQSKKLYYKLKDKTRSLFLDISKGKSQLSEKIYYKLRDKTGRFFTDLTQGKSKLANKFNSKIKDKIGKILNKESYEGLLKQDSFWIKTVTWSIMGTTLFGIGWLAFAKTEEIILVPGAIVPIGAVKEIKMPVTGVVKSILVKEGERVKKGQLLLLLDNDDNLEREKTLEEAIRIKENQYEFKLIEISKFLKYINEEISLIKETIDLQSEIMNNFKYLFEEGAVGKLEYLNEKIKLQNSQANYIQMQSKLQTSKASYEQQIDDVRSSLNELRGQHLSNKVKLKTKKILSPQDGIIFDLQPNSIGYSANISETILKLVPLSGLEARIEIPSRDIGFVKKGMKVDISIDSFPSTDFGVVKGHVKTIGSDALNPDPQENRRDFVYPSRVNLSSQNLLLDNGNELPLKVGMSLNANIKLRKVTYLQLLLTTFKSKTDTLKEL